MSKSRRVGRGSHSQHLHTVLREVTRKIKPDITRDLWVLAGGRCQFRDCNELLYKSPITQEKVNRAQKAHIYSFSLNGPRGRGPYAKNAKDLNSTKNLLLVCHGCHQTIDQRGGCTRYPAALLQQWKQEHKARIVRVTGVNPKRKTHVVLYGSRIGTEDSPLQPDAAMETVFPNRFPARDMPINLSPKLEHNDGAPTFWATEAAHLRNIFERDINPLIRESSAAHFSLFGLADMPLLIVLGSLFTDKRTVDVYQLHREPQGWRWQNDALRGFNFKLKHPRHTRGEPALVFSLSGSIDPERIRAVLGPHVAIWELTIANPHNDFLRSRRQLILFREAVRNAMATINHAHGLKPVHVFPAMPVACAIELGRVRMPHSDPPWILYNQNNKLGGFTKALTIGKHHECTQ